MLLAALPVTYAAAEAATSHAASGNGSGTIKISDQLVDPGESLKVSGKLKPKVKRKVAVQSPTTVGSAATH